jgi:hypothetical protein
MLDDMMRFICALRMNAMRGQHVNIIGCILLSGLCMLCSSTWKIKRVPLMGQQASFYRLYAEGPKSPNETVKITIREEVETYLTRKQPALPPETPGAFIHVGKTGGSTLCRHLKFCCHSFVPKPCPTPNKFKLLNESYISKTTTYSKFKPMCSVVGYGPDSLTFLY